MKVILVTSNSIKLKEFIAKFNLYGIEVVQSSDDTMFSEPEKYLVKKETIAILKESTRLTKNDVEVFVDDIPNLSVVWNTSTLDVVYLNKKGEGFTRKTYTKQIDGYIDRSKQTPKGDRQEVFGWDDIFVNKFTQKTNQQMKELNLKLSARDLSVADFIKDRLFYGNASETVKFMDKEQFIEGKVFLKQVLETNEKYGVSNVIKKFLNNNIFTREANNRREKNYWLPNLNSGLPLTKKKDKFHEETYMFHDIGHLMLPDLVADTPNPNLHDKRVYVIHRLMSEAFTLVLGDMLFVDLIKKSGYEYDYTKRKIYPLFENFKESYNVLKNKETLKALFYSVAKYFILGDDHIIKRYVNSSDAKLAFENFKGKYDNFAIADMWWTEQNFNQMTQDKAITNRRFPEHKYPTDINWLYNYVNWCVNQHSEHSSVENIFDIVFDSYFNKLDNLLDSQTNEDFNTNLFFNYMRGQCFIFSKFDFIPESAIYHTNIVNQLTTLHTQKTISLKDIQNIREYYNQYIDILESKNLIQTEESEIYKQLYPIFQPKYVDYDVEQGVKLIDRVKSTLEM